MSKRALLASSLLLLPAISAAQPVVVTDIPPVQSVMGKLTDALPEVLAGPGTDPHHFALRPSDLRQLNEADLVVWMGPAMSPWLDDALSSLDTKPDDLMLLGLMAGVDDHEHEHDHSDDDHDHGHDDHDDHHDHGDETHDHDHDHAQDEAGHDHDDEHAHDEHGHDDHNHDHAPNAHQWLSITAVQDWVAPMAAALSAADPENAAQYSARASAFDAELAALKAEIEELLAPHEGAALVVLHDAYDPFLDEYGLSVAAALRPGDNSAASAARLRAAEASIAEQGATCIFAEPNHDATLAQNLAEDFGLRLGELDPLGSQQAPGPDHYAATMRAMAMAIDNCLRGVE